MIAKAIKLAAQIHDGQVDKGGEPYIFHALTVMRMTGERVKHMRFVDEEFRQNAMIVAVLHDAVEDFEGSASERRRIKSFILSTFGLDVYEAVDAITHEANATYEDYIELVAQNPLATVVKICDLTHNSDPRRMPDRDITEKDLQRWNKYRKALVRLEREA